MEVNAMLPDEYMELRKLAREVAEDSPVIMALEKYVLQIVGECVRHARAKERERLASILEGYHVPISADKLAAALRKNKFIFPDMHHERAKQ